MVAASFWVRREARRFRILRSFNDLVSGRGRRFELVSLHDPTLNEAIARHYEE